MPLNPAFLQAGSGIASALAEITRPRREYKWNKRAAADANAMNRANQQWMLEQERALRDEARVYDSPASQMQRYLEAGLNPHLIYGSGSSAGQAFPIHAGSLPGVNIEAPSPANPIPSFIGAAQGVAQLGLTGARTDATLAKAALDQLQLEINKTNPMLDPGVASWVRVSMEETARLKSMEARHWLAQRGGISKIGMKVNAELDAMIQRLGLNSADLRIRNQIFQSKEFENAIKEIQARWLQDADVSPEHIRQALMLLLSKMVGR